MVLESSESFVKYDKILNYIKGVEIKITKDRGRGLFAAKSLKKGELLIVEKAIADVATDK